MERNNVQISGCSFPPNKTKPATPLKGDVVDYDSSLMLTLTHIYIFREGKEEHKASEGWSVQNNRHRRVFRNPPDLTSWRKVQQAVSSSQPLFHCLQSCAIHLPQDWLTLGVDHFHRENYFDSSFRILHSLWHICSHDKNYGAISCSFHSCCV